MVWISQSNLTKKNRNDLKYMQTFYIMQDLERTNHKFIIVTSAVNEDCETNIY